MTADALLGGPPMAQQADDSGVHILAVDPFEPARVKVELMERRFRAVEAVEVGDPLLQSLMGRVFEQVPVEAIVMRPFAPLADLSSHENEFLAACAYMYPKSVRRLANFCQSSPGIFRRSEPLPWTTSSWESGSKKFS